MATKKNGNDRKLAEIAVLVAIFLGVAGIAFWQFATSFEAQGANSGSPFDNAAMFPRLVSWSILILACVQIALTLLTRQKNGPEGIIDLPEGAGSEPIDPPLDTSGDTHLTFRAFACLGVFVLYLMTTSTVGYILSTIVMLTAMFIILKARPLTALIVAVGATFVLGFVFNTLLSVVLPVGRLGLPTIF